MQNLHVIGDSHSMEVTWGGIDVVNIISHHLGPWTCAWFGIEKPIIEFNPEDWVCFCFGEIDCRDNLGLSTNWREITDKIVENYFYTISLYKAEKIFVFNIPPAVIQKTAAGNPWPCTGTDEERRKYVKYFNASLKRKCTEYNYIFFDVHDKYADDEGYFNLAYRDHCVHINNPIFLIEFLNEVINNTAGLQS